MSKARLSLLLADSAALFANELNRALFPASLKQYIKKARFSADASGYQRHLLQLFCGQAITTPDLPIASLRGGKAQSLCADPCYLHPDRDRLLLFSQGLDLTLDEARGIAELVQPLLAEFNASLHIQSAEQWLLELDSLPEVEFSAMEGLHGLPVSDFLPRGPQSEDWIRLWNEIQMLLFDSDVNQRREAAGKVPVNSLWFWGMGTMPSWRQWPLVSGQEAMLQTLASASESGFEPDINRFDAIHHKPALKVLSIDIEQDMQAQLQQLNDDWLAPAWSALKKWQLRELELIVPDWGVYTLTPWNSWRIW